MTVVSPCLFGTLQRLQLIGTWILLLCVIFGVALALHHWMNVAWPQLALLVVVTGWLPLGYAAWMGSNEWRGLIATPSYQWTATLREDAVFIEGARFCTAVPLQDISRAELVSDGSFDRLKGIEDECLVLFPRRALRISIPGSSQGFRSLLQSLSGKVHVEPREL